METQTLMIDGIPYAEEDVIRFIDGLPGFEHLQNFLISSSEEHAPFHWMHCLDDPDLKFILVNPMMLCPTYEPKINKGHLRDLDLKDKSDILMYVIVTLDQVEFSNSTANLLGPIIVNIRGRKGCQILLDDIRYSTKHSILPEKGGE